MSSPRVDFEPRGRDERMQRGVLFFLFRTFRYRTVVFFGPDDHRTYQGWTWHREFTGEGHEERSRQWAAGLFSPAEEIAALLEGGVGGFRYQ